MLGHCPSLLRSAIAASALLALSACGGGEGEDGTTSSPVTASPTPSPSPVPQPAPSPTPTPVVNIDDERQRELNEVMLAEHNRARTEMAVQPVELDVELGAEALEYAEVLAANGRFEHSPGSDRVGQGENLWRGTAGAFGYERMFGGWYDEKQHFVPGRFPDVSRTDDWRDVGHYTQIIWKDTTRIGCGIATGQGWDVLVCRYAPPGNVIGQLVI